MEVKHGSLSIQSGIVAPLLLPCSPFGDARRQNRRSEFVLTADVVTEQKQSVPVCEGHAAWKDFALSYNDSVA